MKISLIFSPPVSPTCIPLGIASLKAYIEKNIPQANVTLLDLNLSFTNRILSGQCHDLNNICRNANIICRHKKRGCYFNGSLLEEQEAIFRKARFVAKDRELFFDKEIFRLFLGDCHKYILSLDGCVRKIIASYLCGNFKDTRIITNFFKEELESIERTQPDVIGFSLLVNGQLSYSLALAKMLKERLNVPIIFGGPALFCYDSNKIISAFNFIDFMVLKEGEEAIVGLLKNIGTKDFGDIPNLLWKKGHSLVSNENRGIKDLNTLPTPDFRGLKLKEYFSPELVLPLATARGCPWSQCKFCQLNTQYSGSYRERAIENVLNDIRCLKNNFDTDNFFITDSEISSHRLEKISKSIIKSRMKIYFACYARPTKNLNSDILKTVYRSGGRFFQLGVETFSERCLQFINKGTTVNSIKHVLAYTYQLGIKNLVYMIACIPSQTRKELLYDLKQIASFKKKYGIFSIIYCLYRLGGNQPFYKALRSLGIIMRRKGKVLFTVNGYSIRETNNIEFSYKNNGAYDILNEPKDKKTVNAIRRADMKLFALNNRFGIYNGEGSFLILVNDFLFETQLIFAKKTELPSLRSPIKNKITGFYLRKKMALLSKIP